MGFMKEFKEFAMRGNVVDLAVAVIIGGAFGKIVSSLVGDVVMPIVGLLLGGVNFSGLSITVGDAVIKYGAFIQAIVDFVIIAFVIFLALKALSNAEESGAAGRAGAPAGTGSPPYRDPRSAEEGAVIALRRVYCSVSSGSVRAWDGPVSFPPPGAIPYRLSDRCERRVRLLSRPLRRTVRRTAAGGGIWVQRDDDARCYTVPTTALMAATLTMSLTLHPRDRSNAGFRSPCTTGPIASAPARRCASL